MIRVIEDEPIFIYWDRFGWILEVELITTHKIVAFDDEIETTLRLRVPWWEIEDLVILDNL